MSHWLTKILGGWRGLFQPRQPTVDRSRLMGMYLSQANQPLDSSGRGSDTRARQEGKFSQNRRRG